MKNRPVQADFGATIRACFAGYVVQAIVNNFVPLLFITFHREFGIPLSKITLLVTFNFGLQLLIDLCSVFLVDRLGYRVCAVLAHVFSASGLLLLTILPALLPDAFTGILISVTLYAVGGGLLEVLISPIVEACPTDNKETQMSLLHAFYCWGHVAVVLFSTLFFFLFGISQWKILALLWALLPILNGIAFTRVPIRTLAEEHGIDDAPLKNILSTGTFWLFFLLMICSGASEQAVSQWASTFAEMSLGVSKSIGDLAGPMAFGVLMGLSRTLYGKFGEKIPLVRFMIASTLLCILSNLLISLSGIPALSLLGCALTGLSVGIMWPGTFSLSSANIRGGGTAMFALLALAGDVGCMGGPTLAGFVAGAFGDNLHLGILCSIVFPSLMLVGLIRVFHWERSSRAEKQKA